MNNLEKIANPTKFFQSPEELNNDNSLSALEKIKSLENWLDEIVLKQIAEEENMLSDGIKQKDFTRSIHELLASLRDSIHA
ncbi:MAG: hypothetical protein H0U70_05490 [Tatlockia sp.]|nr:hypothetical protein [Tatlockia sp.]